jgi:hypothetical protein
MQHLERVEVGGDMRTIVDPKQKQMFDPYDRVLTPKTRQCLLKGWQGVFRHMILHLMPAETLGGSFDASMGRPTKELYAMAGLLFIKEFMDWTMDEAVSAYMFHMDVQYALNLEPVAHELSRRTLERYQGLFVENELAARVMDEVTMTLVEALGLKADQQRLDSTHIFSDMASFGRTRLMGVTIKRFLTQLKRHDPKAYEALEEDLRRRYEPSTQKLFGEWGKDEKSRHRLRAQVADDMHRLVKRFNTEEEHNGRSTYKAMERIFYEQCEVEEEKVLVKKKTGGKVMQNPSDPDATYDGHKGPGYQVQISETCNSENEAQIITSALPETAVESDTAALPKVLDDLEKKEVLPDELTADTPYCSDENVQEAERRGVELIGPTKEGAESVGSSDEEKIEKAQVNAYELNIDDFVVEEGTEIVVRCPAGHEPVSSTYDAEKGKTTTVMSEAACSGCEFSGECLVRRVKGQYRVEHTAKDRRLAGRRREEQTEVFRERYCIRAGIEGTNSGVKRRTGLGRLRVRGRAQVFNAILLRLAGWNILRATVCATMRKLVAESARLASLTASLSPIPGGICRLAAHAALRRVIRPQPTNSSRTSGLSIAA